MKDVSNSFVIINITTILGVIHYNSIPLDVHWIVDNQLMKYEDELPNPWGMTEIQFM